MSRRLFAAALMLAAAPALAQNAPAPRPAAPAPAVPANELSALTCVQLIAKYEAILQEMSEEKQTAVMDDVAAAKAAQTAKNETECKARMIKVLSLP